MLSDLVVTRFVMPRRTVTKPNYSRTTKSKDDFDRHFGIVVSGAERTRGVLYFFSLILVVNVVFFFEDAFNTSNLRLKIVSGAVACLGSNLGQSGAVPLNGDYYESHPQCGYYYNYVRNYYFINIPEDNPLSIDSQSRNVLSEKYKAVLKDDTDYLSTTIPLLNIRIDRNDGLILQNTMAVVVLSVLFFSLHAERKTLSRISKLAGSDHARISAILDTHVFNRAAAGKIALGFAILLPVFSQFYRLYQDLRVDTKIVQDLYGPFFGILYLFIEPASLLVTFFIAAYCLLEASELNRALKNLERGAKLPIFDDGRDMMNRRLDLLAILLIATTLALFAVPALARVNP